MQNGKYLASIISDSAIMCDEVIESYDEEIKSISTNLNKATCKLKNVHLYLYFINFDSNIDSC